MKNKLNKTLLIISLLLISILVIIINKWYTNLFNYYRLGYSPQYDNICHKKRMTWDKEIYLINKNLNNEKIVLKVENRNKEAWYELLKPVASRDEQFKTCVKGVKKYPDSFENLQPAGKELKKRSKGIELSIGIQKAFTYKPLAMIILNIELYANKFNNENYNLDLALQNIAENYSLIRESNRSLRLQFNAPLGDKFDIELPFFYEFARLNGKEVTPNSSIEFISSDNGDTWHSVIVQKY